MTKKASSCHLEPMERHLAAVGVEGHGVREDLDGEAKGVREGRGGEIDFTKASGDQLPRMKVRTKSLSYGHHRDMKYPNRGMVP